MSTKPKWTLLTLALVVLTLTLSKSAVAQLVLYDNFNSNRINPSKWIGAPAAVDEGGDIYRRDVAVELAGEGDRRLRLFETVYSATNEDSGASRSGFGLGFANSNRITALRFTLAVKKAQALGCGANPAFVVAGSFGHYFNPNPTSSPHDSTGDIVAGIGMNRFSSDPESAVLASGSIGRCNDPKCADQTNLSFHELGLVQRGSTNTLSVVWDRPNHQFIFRLNDNTPVASPYTISDSFPPGLADKSFFVFGFVPHCTTTPRPFTTIEAFFDKVYVNP